MVRERLCEWSNCLEDANGSAKRVSISYRQRYANGEEYEKPMFCCADHAALWLINRSRPVCNGTAALVKHVEERLSPQL
jgi:hypothetical protein